MPQYLRHVFGQAEDTDYEVLPVEDNAPIMKLPADADRNSVVVFTATTGDGTCGTLNTVYYDGLGRVKEEVGVGITPQKNDIVTWHEYSSLERKEWQGVPIPTASQGAGCKTKDKYIEEATKALSDNNPYTKYSYENSPLGRLKTVTGALFYNTVNDEFQRYKFNRKELDRLLGIDMYDYGARMYDPILCRWNTPDPLADDYQNISPYAYCLDNPVKFVDPDGRSVWTKMLKGGYRMAKAVSKKGFSALTQADTYYDIVSDITENANMLLSDEASSEEKFIAGASLASEFLPVSIGDVKDGVKIVKAVHGNSKASTRAQHAYDIIEKAPERLSRQA